MISISVKSDVERITRQLGAITTDKNLRFAVARALTMTAANVQTEVRGNMPQRFTLRRQWVVSGIRFEKATPDNLSAVIGSRDKFMELQEAGGTKNPLRGYLAVPTSLVRRTPKQLIKKADRPKNLGNKAEVIEFKGRKYLALKRGRKSKKNNVKLRLMYLLIPRANIRERLGLRKDAERMVQGKFTLNFMKSLQDALRTVR